MAKNDKLRSRTPYKTGQSPEPLEQFDWDTLTKRTTERAVHIGTPGLSAIITTLIFILIIASILVKNYLSLQ